MGRRLFAWVNWAAVGCALFGCAVATLVQHATGSERDGNWAGLGATIAAVGVVLAWYRWRRR
jgi:xanthine/uracil permease